MFAKRVSMASALVPFDTMEQVEAIEGYSRASERQRCASRRCLPRDSSANAGSSSRLPSHCHIGSVAHSRTSTSNSWSLNFKTHLQTLILDRIIPTLKHPPHRQKRRDPDTVIRRRAPQLEQYLEIRPHRLARGNDPGQELGAFLDGQC